MDLEDVVGRAALRIWPLDRFGTVEGGDHAAVPDPDVEGAAAIGALPAVGYVIRRRPRKLRAA